MIGVVLHAMIYNTTSASEMLKAKVGWVITGRKWDRSSMPDMLLQYDASYVLK